MSDEKKIRRLFAPKVVPEWLTDDQEEFCLILCDAVLPANRIGGTHPNVRKMFVVLQSKTPVGTLRFMDYLTLVFRENQEARARLRVFIHELQTFIEFVKPLPQWKQNECFERLLSGEKIEGWN